MAQDSGLQQKADQIAHRFFAKFVLVIDNARNVATDSLEDAKVDKWFNLEAPDPDLYKDQMRLYKSISQLGAPPPLELQVLLTVPELSDKQVLVQHPPNSSRMRVEPTPTHVLLESWTLTFTVSKSDSPSSSQMSTGEVTLATVYKHIMSVMRSLYTLLRVLPTWKICKRLRRRPGAGSGARNGQLGLMLRVQARGSDPSGSEDLRYLGFDEPLSPNAAPLETSTHTFDPVTHPKGVFSVGLKYLKAPHFEIDTVEALLSSRFLSLDAGPEFTPTLARASQRESSSGSPGSLPMRTSLPDSPPSRMGTDKTGLGLALGAGTTSSIADRFVFPASNTAASGSRTSFPSTSPRSRNVPLPAPGPVQRSISAQQAQAAAGNSAGSVGSSSRHSREEGRESLPSIARVRRESTGMGRGSELPSGPAPLLIRRPSTNVSPFKAGPLSSGSLSLQSNSPSLRQGSPLAGPSLPSAPVGRTSAGIPPSPTSTRLRTDVGSGAGPSSPITSTSTRAGLSPMVPLRPSPPTPFAPSSLGERKFPPSPKGSSPSGELLPTGSEPLNAPPRRKRYSSSFGYRHTPGSAGSAGSGEKGKDLERPGSSSYLSANTDDDDISAFVQDIDARKPLGGGLNTSHDRVGTPSEVGSGPGAIVQPEVTGQAQESQASSQSADRPIIARRRSRTISEGPRASALAREAAAATVDIGEGPRPTVPLGSALNHLDIEERLRALNNAFRTSMDLVERRPSSTDGSTRPTVPSPFPARPFPIPGAAHLRTPSFSASGGLPSDRPSSAPGQARSSSSSEAVSRRLLCTPGTGGSGGENSSVWGNRRFRSDSNGSSASGLSEMDRARIFYEQGRVSRGSGVSVGAVSMDSGEAVGRMSLEQMDE